MAMFENISVFFKRFMQNDKKELVADTTSTQSKDAAKERLHVVLMQDRANVSADFLELMKEEIIDVIKKYIVIDESQIDVRLTNQENEDGSMGAPLLHANIPIINIRNDVKGEYLKEDSDLSDEKTTIDPVEKDAEKTQIIQTVKEIVEESKPENSGNQKEEKIDPNKDTFEVAIEVESAENQSTSKSNKEDSFDEELEDDDDVTFDDLLKAAEEDERRQKKLANKNQTNKKSGKSNNQKRNGSKKKTNNKKTNTNKKTPLKNDKTKKEV